MENQVAPLTFFLRQTASLLDQADPELEVAWRGLQKELFQPYNQEALTQMQNSWVDDCHDLLPAVLWQTYFVQAPNRAFWQQQLATRQNNLDPQIKELWTTLLTAPEKPTPAEVKLFKKQCLALEQTRPKEESPNMVNMARRLNYNSALQKLTTDYFPRFPLVAEALQEVWQVKTPRQRPPLVQLLQLIAKTEDAFLVKLAEESPFPKLASAAWLEDIQQSPLAMETFLKCLEKEKTNKINKMFQELNPLWHNLTTKRQPLFPAPEQNQRFLQWLLRNYKLGSQENPDFWRVLGLVSNSSDLPQLTKIYRQTRGFISYPIADTLAILRQREIS